MSAGKDSPTFSYTQPGYRAFNRTRAEDLEAGGDRREEEGKGSNRNPPSE